MKNIHIKVKGNGFYVPEIKIFDPGDLAQIYAPEYSTYPPPVLIDLFRKTMPRVIDIPERIISLYEITSDDSKSKNDDTPSLSLDYLFNHIEQGRIILSPGHVLPLAYAIIETEYEKRKGMEKEGCPYSDIPWAKGASHTLFQTFLIDKSGQLDFVSVEFNWIIDMTGTASTFGLCIQSQPCDIPLPDKILLAAYLKS